MIIQGFSLGEKKFFFSQTFFLSFFWHWNIYILIFHCTFNNDDKFVVCLNAFRIVEKKFSWLPIYSYILLMSEWVCVCEWNEWIQPKKKKCWTILKTMVFFHIYLVIIEVRIFFFIIHIWHVNYCNIFFPLNNTWSSWQNCFFLWSSLNE